MHNLEDYPFKIPIDIAGATYPRSFEGVNLMILKINLKFSQDLSLFNGIPIAANIPKITKIIPPNSMLPGTSSKISAPSKVPNTGTRAMNKAVRAGPITGIQIVKRTTAITPTKIP